MASAKYEIACEIVNHNWLLTCSEDDCGECLCGAINEFGAVARKTFHIVF